MYNLLGFKMMPPDLLYRMTGIISTTLLLADKVRLIAVSAEQNGRRRLQMKKKLADPKYLAPLALLVAIELVMKMTGLGSVPVGPLYMSFLTVPIAIGAIILGPTAGGILGAVFGAVSFKDAVTGASVMGSMFFQISPINTFILCVVMRVLMGVCVGWIFLILKKVAYGKNFTYVIGALSAPLLNTFFFMGYICLVFYNTEYIQGICQGLGATNPIMFVVLLVGMQGLIEAVVCGVVGSIITKALSKILGN